MKTDNEKILFQLWLIKVGVYIALFILGVIAAAVML